MALAVKIPSKHPCWKRLSLFGVRLDRRELTIDGELQCKRRVYDSASGVGERYYQTCIFSREMALYRNRAAKRAGKRAMYWPQPKKVYRTKKPVHMLSKAKKLVMNFFAGICTTLKDCMLLDQHSNVAGRGIDSEILICLKTDHLLAFALQKLSSKLDKSGNHDIKVQAKLHESEMAALLASKISTVREVLYGLDTTQVMLGHVICFLLTLYGGYSLHEVHTHPFQRTCLAV